MSEIADKLKEKARLRWAHNVLSRVNTGEKVPFSDLEKANEIIRQQTETPQPSELKTDLPPDTPQWAGSQVELAAILGCERKTIQRWMKLDGNPGKTSDGRYPVKEWHLWTQIHGKLKRKQLPDKSELECQRLLIDIERRTFEMSILRGEYIHRDIIRQRIVDMVNELKSFMRAKLENELPPQLVGLEPEYIRVKHAKFLDEVCQRCNQGENKIAAEAR